MCPDESTLSCYLDGEVEYVWHTRIEEHLKDCAACQDKFSTLRSMKRVLLDDDEPDHHQSMTRVAQRIELARDSQMVTSSPLKKYRVVLPVPVVIAASIVALFLGFFIALFTQNSDLRTMQIMKEASGTTLKVAAPIEDLEQLIRALGSEFDREIVIQLPELPKESVFFMVNEEPKFLSEAEFVKEKGW